MIEFWAVIGSCQLIGARKDLNASLPMFIEGDHTPIGGRHNSVTEVEAVVGHELVCPRLLDKQALEVHQNESRRAIRMEWAGW